MEAVSVKWRYMSCSISNALPLYDQSALKVVDSFSFYAGINLEGSPLSQWLYRSCSISNALPLYDQSTLNVVDSFSLLGVNFGRGLGGNLALGRSVRFLPLAEFYE